jgi:hypothetical protein
VGSVKSAIRAYSVPLTTHVLSEVFRLSASRASPFHPFQNEDKRIGLQDAAIYLSLIEDLRARGGRGAFVSDDNIYEERGLAELAPGISLKRYRDLDTVQKDLEKGLSETRQRRLDEDRQQAIHALEGRRSDLERHLNENFSPVLSYWSIMGVGTAKEITRIEVVRIQSAQTTNSSTAGEAEQQVDISAQVQVLFHVLVEESSPYFFTVPEVPAPGDQVVMSKPPAYTLGYTIAMPSSEYVLSGVIPVQATAVVRNGRYEDIVLGPVGEAKDMRVHKRPDG